MAREVPVRQPCAQAVIAEHELGAFAGLMVLHVQRQSTPIHVEILVNWLRVLAIDLTDCTV